MYLCLWRDVFHIDAHQCVGLNPHWGSVHSLHNCVNILWALVSSQYAHMLNPHTPKKVHGKMKRRLLTGALFNCNRKCRKKGGPAGDSWLVLCLRSVSRWFPAQGSDHVSLGRLTRQPTAYGPTEAMLIHCHRESLKHRAQSTKAMLIHCQRESPKHRTQSTKAI